jgi:hypothetical protein
MSTPIQVKTRREMPGATIGCAASIDQGIDRSTPSGLSTTGARVAA